MLRPIPESDDRLNVPTVGWLYSANNCSSVESTTRKQQNRNFNNNGAYKHKQITLTTLNIESN